MAIMRGTTPTHTFHVDADLTGASIIIITYKQGCITVVEKETKDISVTEETVEVVLTQQETLRFRNMKDTPVKIQISAQFPDKKTIRSNIMRVPVEEVLKEEVI